MQAEPLILRPSIDAVQYEAPLPKANVIRFAPKRGLVRKIRRAAAADMLRGLAVRHRLDRETRELLSAELVKLGAPPISLAAATTAFERLVHFNPLNTDALHPFLIVGTHREDRALAVASIATSMQGSGRSVRILSDALDASHNSHLQAAGKKLGCGVQRFENANHCAEVLREGELASLNIIEAGMRLPMDRQALLRLQKLCISTGAEPVAVIRPNDALQALGLARIGVRRMIFVETGENVLLGPALSAARRGNLSFSDILSLHRPSAPLRHASASDLAKMLTDFHDD